MVEVDNQAKQDKELPEDYGAKTAATALRVLNLFSHVVTEWTVKDIAQALDLPYSTAYRYVSTLQASGYLQRQDRTGVYRIGLAVIELAGVALNQLDVRVHGLAYLDHLADVTRLNANLAVLYEADVLHVGYAVRSRVPRMYTILGRRTPAHLTALGKAMLAYRPFWEVKRLIEEHGWRPRTPKSICSFPELERELNLIRQRGYALDDQEQNLDTRCVGAPIRNRLGSVIGAISVSALVSDGMTEERLSELAHAVVEHASMISYRLGYDETQPILSGALI